MKRQFIYYFKVNSYTINKLSKEVSVHNGQVFPTYFGNALGLYGLITNMSCILAGIYVKNVSLRKSKDL